MRKPVFMSGEEAAAMIESGKNIDEYCRKHARHGQRRHTVWIERHGRNAETTDGRRADARDDLIRRDEYGVVSADPLGGGHLKGFLRQRRPV